MPLFGPPNIEKMKGKRDLKGLTKALTYWKSSDVRKSAAQALETLGWEPDNSEAGASYWALNHRWEKCIEIGSPAVKPLLMALDHENDVRLPIAAALGQIGDARASSPLIAFLEDEDADMRAAALKALERIGALAVPQLIDALKKQAGGKWYTTNQLVKIADQLLQTNTPTYELLGELEIPTAEALVRMGAPAVEPVIAALKDEDWRVQFVASRVLEKIGDTRAVEPLVGLGDDQGMSLAGRATGIILLWRGLEARCQLTRVDVLLAIYFSGPKTLLNDLPVGDRLKAIAAETLKRHDPIQKLYASTYVRAVVSGGGLSIAEKEVQVRSEAPGMMKDLLQERELDPEGYRLELWAEELSPKIKVVWVAAIRK